MRRRPRRGGKGAIGPWDAPERNAWLREQADAAQRVSNQGVGGSPEHKPEEGDGQQAQSMFASQSDFDAFDDAYRAQSSVSDSGSGSDNDSVSNEELIDSWEHLIDANEEFRSRLGGQGRRRELSDSVETSTEVLGGAGAGQGAGAESSTHHMASQRDSIDSLGNPPGWGRRSYGNHTVSNVRAALFGGTGQGASQAARAARNSVGSTGNPEEVNPTPAARTR